MPGGSDILIDMECSLRDKEVQVAHLMACVYDEQNRTQAPPNLTILPPQQKSTVWTDWWECQRAFYPTSTLTTDVIRISSRKCCVSMRSDWS